MTYDLLIKNGRVIDGSGRPAYHGDVGVAKGKIVELGRLSGSARQTIEADGRVVSPGFVDNHCHYDAQVVWDPLCTYSCHHGSTTVIIGNCSLALAPVKPEAREKLAGMLSYVEAIPMDVLQAGVPWNWETFPQYMSAIGQRLGVQERTVTTHLGHIYRKLGTRGRLAALAAVSGDLLEGVPGRPAVPIGSSTRAGHEPLVGLVGPRTGTVHGGVEPRGPQGLFGPVAVRRRDP